jgi:SAM-dependent methyltransferase
MPYTIDIHQMMLADTVRTSSYERAIQEVVTGDTRVLDFGCGTGILALFAARAGARRVFAVDRSPFIHMAKAIARQNGYDRIEFIHAEGAEVELPEPVDVIVAEWMGNFVFYENMLDPLVALRDRYLAPGGVMIPGRIALRAALVRDPAAHEELGYFRRQPYGFDFSPLGDWPFHRTNVVLFSPPQLLSPTMELGEIDVHSCAAGPPGFLRGAMTPDEDATVYGICGWFEVYLTPATSFDTGPAAPKTHWRQLFFPFREPFPLKAGRETSIAIRPLWFGADRELHWTWSISHDGQTLAMDDIMQQAWIGRPLDRGPLL